MRGRIVLSASLLLFGTAGPPVLSAQDHIGQYSQADIDRGSRLYSANCALCHGDTGDSVQNVSLRSGRFRRAASDEELGRLIVAGVPGTAMPPHKLDPAGLIGLIAYLRSMRDARLFAAAGGDPARGRAIFEGKGACLDCHRVAGRGARSAPDLSEIGVLRRPSTLLRSLVDPTSAMLPINRPVRAVTRDGQAIEGRRLNEDTYSVQLITTDERLLSLAKADLREYTISKTSPMPSYREKLTPAELADVVAYLRDLKGIE